MFRRHKKYVLIGSPDFYGHRQYKHKHSSFGLFLQLCDDPMLADEGGKYPS